MPFISGQVGLRFCFLLDMEVLLFLQAPALGPPPFLAT
jgi:hypothetical protein